MLEETKQYAEAETGFREAIRLAPGDSRVHSNLGMVLLALHRYAEAEAANREAIRLDPGSAAAHSNLGEVLRRTNRYAEGRGRLP